MSGVPLKKCLMLRSDNVSISEYMLACLGACSYVRPNLLVICSMVVLKMSNYIVLCFNILNFYLAILFTKIEAVDHNINSVKKRREFYRFGGRLGTIVEWCLRDVVYTVAR